MKYTAKQANKKRKILREIFVNFHKELRTMRHCLSFSFVFFISCFGAAVYANKDAYIYMLLSYARCVN